MMDAAEYEALETLKNGTLAKIRAIRSDDKKRLSQAFRNLESESVYKRFFSYKKDLTDRELKLATEVDFENEVALVVTVGEGDTETIIGGARYAAFGAPGAERKAEVAFAVEEDYQGQGIAGRLLRHLVSIARRKGVAQFEAEVLAGNKGMLTVFTRSGLPMKHSVSDGTAHVVLSLKEGRPPEIVSQCQQI
jgi:GNAT superfamily N-acetyltransferase